MYDHELEELLQEVEGMSAPELACWIKGEREKMRTGKDLSIRPNNLASNGRCPVCGDRTDPRCGPELFLRGTFREVCHECGDRLNPALMLRLRDLAMCWDNVYRGECDLATLEAMESECPFYEPHADALGRLKAVLSTHRPSGIGDR